MKFKTCNTPILLELFFNSNLDLENFRYNNECYLREFSIKNYINSSDNNTLYLKIKEMIINNIHFLENIYIDKEFPKKKIKESLLQLV